MKALRLTPEQLADIQKRFAGNAREHRIAKPEDDIPEVSADYLKVERKPSKYRNKYTVVDGRLCQSKKEAERLKELKLLEAAGKISGLDHQRAFNLRVNGVLICRYIADFVYTENGVFVVEDSKGYRTRAYIMKKKLMKAVLGIDIKET